MLDLFIGHNDKPSLLIFISVDSLFPWHLDTTGRTVPLIMEGRCTFFVEEVESDIRFMGSAIKLHRYVHEGKADIPLPERLHEVMIP